VWADTPRDRGADATTVVHCRLVFFFPADFGQIPLFYPKSSTNIYNYKQYWLHNE
jgi:hypothetical protein